MINTPDISAAVTIQSIVADVLTPNHPESVMIDMLKLAIRGVKKLNIFYLDIPKAYIGEVSPINFMNLPPDCVDLTYIGYISDGKIHNIGRHNRIKFTLLEENGLEEAFSENTNGLKTPDYKHYSLPSGYTIANARHNERMNRIEFKGNAMGCPIYIEYISTGVGADTFIPAIAQESIIRWVEWTLAEKDPDAPQYDKQWKKKLYDEELSIMMTFRKRLPPVEEFMRKINTTRKQTIKG